MHLFHRLTVSLLLATVAGGCTRYGFAIVDPPDVAGTVQGKEELAFTTDAAEYRLRAVEGRLVMFIYNSGSTAVELVATKSTVVSEQGSSHPVLGQTIAAGSFIKLILPPTRPQLQPDRGAVSFGFGVSSGGYYRDDWYTRSRYRTGSARGRYSGPYDEPYFYDPPSYTVYDASNPAFWDWRGETQITLTLVFSRDGKITEDRFVIRRQKLD